MRTLIMGWLAIATGATSLAAADYPQRPITLVVPYTAGGPADAIARLITAHMGGSLGQQFVIENVVGAGGTIGAGRVAKAAADGYTLLIHNLGLPAAPAFYKTLPYDTRSAFEPLGLVNTGPMVLVSKKGLAADTPRELWALLKSKPGALTMAHAGVGANSHLCGLLLSRALGTSLTFVAYRGSGPAMNDILAEQVDLLCDQSTTAVPQVEGGRIKGFVVTGDEPLETLPSVATVADAGLPSFKMTIWHGLYAPKGTPAAIVAILNDALQRALADPGTRERFRQVGTQAFPVEQRTPQAHGKQLISEIERWAGINEASATNAK